MSKFIWKAITTSFGLGMLPWMPGTWGAIGGAIFWYGVFLLESPWVYFFLLLFFLVLGYLAIRQLSIQTDSSQIVVDEWVGVGIALFATDGSFLQWLIAFLLFRLFDILKPPGVRFFDQRFLKGWGIILDDVVAGIYAALLIGAWNIYANGI